MSTSSPLVVTIDTPSCFREHFTTCKEAQASGILPAVARHRALYQYEGRKAEESNRARVRMQHNRREKGKNHHTGYQLIYAAPIIRFATLLPTILPMAIPKNLHM